LDEKNDASEHIKRATDMLLALPVPMPQMEVASPVNPSNNSDPLYVAGPDGLPTTSEYLPEADEGALSEEEVAIMLRELRAG
jgi:hypothetical protein